MHGQALRPEEEFRGTQHEDVFAAVEHVAQDHMHELIDEQGWRGTHAATDEVEIGGFHGPMIDEVVAKRSHHGPVLARVSISDLSDLGGSDRPARIGEQRRVQGALGNACVRRRRKLRPRKIGFEKLIGHKQAAAAVTIKQMMPTGEPEIRHAVTPR